MPGWNECSIYDADCRNQTCTHPTNPRNQGVQCRTRLSQRPCGARDCTREECSRARVSASVLATIPDTENDVTGSESAPQSTSEGESTYTLTGLSARDVERLEQALRMLRRTYTRESVMYRETSELGARVSALNWTPVPPVQDEPRKSLHSLTQDDKDLITGALWTIVHGDSGYETSEDQYRAEQLIDLINEL